MIAKFSGTCSRCGHAIQKGSEIHYDSEAKKAYHPDCCDSGAETAEDTADRLGFVAMTSCWRCFDQGCRMCKDWPKK